MRTTDVDRELNLARNLFGRPLTPECRARVLAVLDNPTPLTWACARSVIVGSDGWKTFWQCVLAVRPDFPRADRPGAPIAVPDRAALAAALRYATH